MASRFELVYEEDAETGLYAICAYITENFYNHDAANKLYSKVIQRIELLRDFPEMCPVSYENHRKCVIEHIVAIYHIDETNRQIVITDIVDGRTNYAPDF